MKKKVSKTIVNKFGGGIITPSYIALAKKRIEEQIKNGYAPVVVVSALNGVTDKLISFFSALNKKPREGQKENPEDDKRKAALICSFAEDIRKTHIDMMRKSEIDIKERDKIIPVFNDVLQELKDDMAVITRFGGIDVIQDKILSFGERLSALFFCSFLNVNNIKSKIFLAEDIPIATDSVRLNANINYEKSAKNVRKALRKIEAVPVINGFVGRDNEGNITTLGRGGTDTTACFLAAALKADKVILWKDTEGILSADPRIIPGAKTVPYLNYEEARESGKIVHDKAIRYIKDFNIPMEVASILNPKKYTNIGSSGKKSNGAKIVGYKKNLTLLVVTDDKVSEYGFLYGIAKILSNYEVNMVLIRNTRDSLHIVVENNNGNLLKALRALKEKKYMISRWPVGIVTLIGSLDWKTVNAFNEALFRACSNPQLGAFPYRQCVRLEAVVRESEMKNVMSELHKIFIDKKITN